MIGIRQLSNQRQELYASHFPLETLKPYLLQYYKEAFATIVLYEDNIEVFHETGIFSFDASEPETFNYEEFRAQLIEEFNDRLAVCTVKNLFLHLERFMEDRPLEDDPFHNLVFSISLAPPSREVLLDWEKNIDQRLRRVLYDDRSTEHFQLFPDEVCVVYSHGNHFTSVTSDRQDLIYSVFEDVVERHLAPISAAPLSPEFIQAVYQHVKNYGIIRLKADRLFTLPDGSSFLLVTYPKTSSNSHKRISRVLLDEKGHPLEITETEMIPRWRYHLNYSDLTLLPLILILSLMGFIVLGGLYFKVLFPARPI